MLLILLIPFWVGEIVRTYAIMIFLGNTGAVNLVLKWFRLIERPIPFMYTGFTMGVGIVYLTALYMLLPLYSALEKLPKSYTEVAADLGAGAWVRFRKITLPLILSYGRSNKEEKKFLQNVVTEQNKDENSFFN